MWVSCNLSTSVRTHLYAQTKHSNLFAWFIKRKEKSAGISSEQGSLYLKKLKVAYGVKITGACLGFCGGPVEREFWLKCIWGKPIIKLDLFPSHLSSTLRPDDVAEAALCSGSNSSALWLRVVFANVCMWERSKRSMGS